MLFEAKDVDHQKGKIGFFSDNSTKLMVNYLQIKSNNCSPMNFNIEKFIYSRNCSRFTYNLDTGIFENLW